MKAVTAPPPNRRTGPARRVPWRAPMGWVRRRFRAWWQARLPRTDTQVLTQGNIFILPSRAGLLFAATLLVLLVASINYQLNLGYVLTFLLAGSGIVSIQVTHGTLRALTLRLKPVAPVFAGDAAGMEAVLASSSGARHGIGLKIESADDSTLTWVDVPAGGQATARVSFVPECRGLHELPTLSLETRFPLGLFRAWSIWRPASQVLVYPKPEHPTAPLPAASPLAGGQARSRSGSGGDTEGIRAYRRGDPLKTVVWKKAAKAMETGGELVSRDTSAPAQRELVLDWQHCGARSAEERLSRLTAWVLAAEAAGLHYALRLPGVAIEADHGDAHRRACLEALALCR